MYVLLFLASSYVSVPLGSFLWWVGEGKDCVDLVSRTLGCVVDFVDSVWPIFLEFSGLIVFSVFLTRAPIMSDGEGPRTDR